MTYHDHFTIHYFAPWRSELVMGLLLVAVVVLCWRLTRALRRDSRSGEPRRSVLTEGEA